MLLKATVRNVRRAFREVNAFEMEGDYRPAARAALSDVLETALEGELTAAVAADRYARATTRRDYRCGSYERRLLTEVGELLLRVPRCRGGGVQFQTLRAYARRPAVLDQLILACFVLGMSTRKVATALSAFLDTTLSAQTVSRIAAQLEAAVATFHRRPLQEPYRYCSMGSSSSIAARWPAANGSCSVPMGSRAAGYGSSSMCCSRQRSRQRRGRRFYRISINAACRVRDSA